MKYFFLHITFFVCFNSFSQVYNNPGSFFPDQEGKYIVSGWVKENHINQVKSFENSYIEITTTNWQGSLISKFYPSGKIIDGWQRIIGVFEIPPILYTIEIKLMTDLPNIDCFFDDIRFYPFNGNMKSFVYDEDTQRLMAELDENNYATFYEYDLEGGLIRVKKETERGVYTIQETRSNNPKREEE